MTNNKTLIIDLAKRFGGAEVRVLDTAHLLHAQAYPYAVAVLNGSPLMRRLQAAKLNVIAVPYARSDLRTAQFLARLIRRDGFSIVDAHNVQSQFWSFWATIFTRTHQVATVHSAYKLEHGNSPKGWFYEAVLRLLNIGNTRFIAVSEAVEDYLRHIGIAAEKISLIHNSLRSPKESATDTPNIRQILGWGNNLWVTVVVARLEPVKGINYLLDALKIASDNCPQLRLLIVGDGRSRDALEAQSDALGLSKLVHFTGFREDVSAILPQCDVFCLPSLSEGLPYALLEASAQKLPLLVSAVGGMASLLEHEQTAILVPPSNADALADALCQLTKKPEYARQLGLAAYALVTERFNPKKMLRQIITVYQFN